MRALKSIAGLGAAIVLLALLAAWQLPPRLDWNRYRGAIANFASARMGRQVSIGGQVRLLLLPDAVLVADRVTLADRGDGVSATIGALRLRVAIGALLQGRVVPRRLELDGPAVTLPWPLPRGAAQAVPAGVAGGFTASVEGGSLRIAGVVISGIGASVRTDPDTGAFAAQGSARLGDLPGRFTALIGAPGKDGISTLTVTLDGQGKAQGAGGTLRGRILGGGSVTGDLLLRGPDLSRLLPGPAVAWQAKGTVTAAADSMQAPRLAVMLGDSPAEASATLQFGAAPRLDMKLHVGQLGLDGWGWKALGANPILPVNLDLSATAASLMKGTIRDGHVQLGLGSGTATVKASGLLPGGAALHLDGAMQQGADGARLTARFSLPAPDLPRLVVWLRPVAPPVVDSLPALPVSGDFNGTLGVQPGRAELSGLTGRIGGSNFTGGLLLALGRRPAVSVALALDKLTWPAPVGSRFWAAAQAWPTALTSSFASFDATLDISAATANAGGFTVSRFALQGQGGAQGFLCRRLAADLPGAHAELSGDFRADGSVGDGRFDFAVADAAALKPPVKLPAGLWQGPLHIGLTAAGPPQAIEGQLRGDLGDLRAEAEVKLNTQAPLLSATVTLRHPGAPRLLELAGVADAGAWLGQGSVALLAHVTAAPGQVVASDFSLGAGALRLGGQIGADLSGATPVLTGRLDAPLLTLPPLGGKPDAPLPLFLIQGWQGQIVLTAQQIFTGFAPLAANATGTLVVANDDALLDAASFDVAGGRAKGAAAVDAAMKLPVFAVQGDLAHANVDQLPALPGLPLQGGTVDAAVAVSASGNSPGALLATLNGTLHGTLDGVSLQSIDLPQLARLLTAGGKRLRTTLPAALASGQTGPLSGAFDAGLDNGALTFGDAAFTGEAGSVALSGGIDLPGRAPDLLLRALPAVAKPPTLTVRVLAGKRIVNAQPGVAWAGRK